MAVDTGVRALFYIYRRRKGTQTDASRLSGYIHISRLRPEHAKNFYRENVKKSNIFGNPDTGYSGNKRGLVHPDRPLYRDKRRGFDPCAVLTNHTI